MHPGYLLLITCLPVLLTGLILHLHIKWWRCAWCRCYFNNLGRSQSLKPALTHIEGHGACQNCNRIWKVRLAQLRTSL
jgi:hypothetical protein